MPRASVRHAHYQHRTSDISRCPTEQTLNGVCYVSLISATHRKGAATQLGAAPR